MTDTIKVENGRLIIDIALTDPRLSSSGKTFLVASASTPASGEAVNGEVVKVTLNAFIKNREAK